MRFNSIMNLIDAVISNDTKAVQRLLDEGANPNLVLDVAHVTPLHFAAQNNSLDVVPLLIKAGADLRGQIHPEGSTPLDIAKLHKHEKMVALLEKYLHMN